MERSRDIPSVGWSRRSIWLEQAQHSLSFLSTQVPTRSDSWAPSRERMQGRHEGLVGEKISPRNHRFSAGREDGHA